MADCFSKVKDEIRKTVSEEELSDSAIKRVVEEVEKLKNRPDFRKAAKKLKDDQGRLMASLAKERAENLLKTRNRVEFYLQDAFKGKPVDAMLAAFEGADHLANQGRLSVDARKNVLAYKFQNSLYYGLEEAGVLDIVKKGLIDREIMQELFELKPGGKSGLSGSSEALAAAKVIRSVQRQMLDELRASGIDIGEVPGYIMRQGHDRELINPNVSDQAGDFEKWFAEIMPRLDEKTFEGVSDRTEFMRTIFDDIASGRRESNAVSGVSDELMVLTKGGAANLNKKLGRSRTLHFKSGDDFFEYNQKFGSKDLMQAMVSSMDSTARNAALVQRFGTNPRAAVEADIKRLNIDDHSAKKIRMALDIAEGLTDIPGRGIAAKAVKNIRIIQSMAKLGGSALAGLVDNATTAAQIRSATGVNFLEGLGKGLQGLVSHLPNEEKKRFFKMIWYAADDMNAGMYNRFSVDSGPGLMSRAQDIYFRMNGAEFQASRQRAAAASSVSRYFAEEFATTSWEKLPPQTRGALGSYGIDSSNWHIVQRGVQDVDGVKFMTPEALSELSDDAFSGSGFRSAKEAKNELGLRMAAFLSNVAESGSPVPGAKQKRQLTLGADPKSGIGLAIKLMTQFKSFPLAMHSVLKRSLLNNPDFTETSMFRAIATGQADYQNLSGMIFAGMGFAYIGWTAKEVFAGKEPPDPTNVKTWAETFVRSGTAGLYGDFLFGEYDQMYRSFLKDAVGPALGQMDDVAELYASAIRGEPKAGKALRLLKNNLPGQNLFYTKAAMDYLVWWRINEALNPGYLRRLERRARKENQEFLFFNPTEAR